MREHNENIRLAYNIAKLSRAKKLPKLETLLAKRLGPRTRQTWQQQLEIMLALQSAERRRTAALEKLKGK